MDAVDARTLLVVASFFAAGCPLFEDEEPQDEYEYCSQRFDITSTPDLVFDESTPPAIWQVETTFTGVGYDPGDYYGPSLDVDFSAVAVSNDPSRTDANISISLGEPGQEPWVSQDFAIEVGAPREQFSFDASLVELIADACGDMETCPRELELRIASTEGAVVVVQGLAARLQSNMNTEQFEGCGIAESMADTGPAEGGEESGSASGTGSGESGDSSGTG